MYVLVSDGVSLCDNVLVYLHNCQDGFWCTFVCVCVAGAFLVSVYSSCVSGVCEDVVA